MNAILEMRGISKNFSGVRALRDVNLTVRAGEKQVIKTKALAPRFPPYSKAMRRRSGTRATG